MRSDTGTLSILYRDSYYTLIVQGRSERIAYFVQHLDGIYRAKDKAAALLKLFGYAMRISVEGPPRSASRHWIEIDLEAKSLETNSDTIRRAVDEAEPETGGADEAWNLRRIHQVLDDLDFTVVLHRH